MEEGVREKGFVPCRGDNVRMEGACDHVIAMEITIDYGDRGREA